MSFKTFASQRGISSERESYGSLLGLCAISASTLMVEIVLTKFLSFKLFHHMTFMVLSIAVFSLGASGILTYLYPKFFGFRIPFSFSRLAYYAILYAITISLIIPFFSWLPLNPYDEDLSNLLRLISLPLIFFMLALPFFFAGICICQTFTKSKHAINTIYCFDLFAAAIGTALTPLLLPILGGYGMVALAAILALFGAIAFYHCDEYHGLIDPYFGFIIALVAVFSCLVYPFWAMRTYGIDILTFKETGPKIVLQDFHGIEKTHWNAIARVDVSHTGTSNAPQFRYGLSPTTDSYNIFGRYILLDGGANTRQFKIIGSIQSQNFLDNSLWASPYIIKNHPQHTLIIGGGGGIDILVGKYFKIPQLTVVEMNPAIFDLLNGNEDFDYTHSLKSDQDTRVKLVYDEARHFSTIQSPSEFDILQASGVDTLTAIQTGGMSLTENYLYTLEAVRDYMRILKPDGVLSLTHWRTYLPGTSLRMFITYLTYLDSIQVKMPAKHLFVLATSDWSDSLLKGTPFTNEELERLRDFAKRAHLTVVFDPDHKVINDNPLAYENWYYKLALTDVKTRQQLILDNFHLPQAVHDDKPYFYSFKNNTSFWVNLNQSHISISLIMIISVIGVILAVLPIFYVDHGLIKHAIWFTLYFSICGFAFLLYETAILQLFSIFVGGPTYALSIVLVSILAGYGLGSGVAIKTKLRANNFIYCAIGLGMLFLLLYWLIPILNHVLLPLSLTERLMVSSIIIGFSSAMIGATIANAMSVVRVHCKEMVSWMWGVGSIANAIGSISFVAITQTVGMSSCLLIVAVLYLVANLGLGLGVTIRR